MRIKLLDDFQGRKAGREWNCPWAAMAAKLIAAGKALAVEPCDLHLNPPAETQAAAEPEPAAETPAKKRKR